MTEIDQLLADLGLDVEVVHVGAGRRCGACGAVDATDAVRLPAAA